MTVTAAEMKEIEKRANDRGLSFLEMMENAGKAAFRYLTEREKPLRTAAVFCGRGNNGGDALVLARLLKKAGVGVLIILSEGKSKTEDALTNLYLAALLDIPMVTGALLNEDDIDFITSADVVIDGIYGTGFHGELSLEGEICCGAINGARGLKLALDLPSGVECDSGRTAEGAVRADVTVTFHAEKPCHSIAKENCGRVIKADIGIDSLN